MPDEGEFLRRQAAAALARLQGTVRSLGDDLIEPLQLRGIVRKRPWWSLGAAMLGGFLAGGFLGKRRVASPSPAVLGPVRTVLASVRRQTWRVVRGAIVGALVADSTGRAQPSAVGGVAAPTLTPTPAADEVASP